MKPRPLVLVPAAILSCAFAYWLGIRLGPAPAPPTPSTPVFAIIGGFAVEGSALDLGEPWERADYVHSVVIHNRNPGPTTILDFRTTCGCVSVEPRTLTIAPGGSATIQGKLDLARRTEAEVGQKARPFTVEIQPVLRGVRERDRLGWSLHGIVRSPLTVNVLGVHFPDNLVQGRPFASRIVRATGHTPDLEIHTFSDPELLRIEVRRVEGASSFELVLTPRNDLPAGRLSCKVFVEAVSSSGDRLPPVVFPVYGTIQPRARVLPAQVQFGVKPIGSTAEAVVTLQVPEEETWNVDHIETSSADLSVTPEVGTGVSRGRSFRIKQYVRHEGQQTSTIRFVVRQGNRPMQELPTEVVYHGQVIPLPPPKTGREEKQR